MDFLIFLTGFAAGAIAVFLLSYFVKKQNDRFNKTAFEQMKLQFENTANKLLKESSKSLSDENRERLEDFFLRFKDKIEAFERRNEENFKVESEKLARFDENMKSFLEAGNKISHETTALVNVLKSDNRTQGHWGEIVLERVLEASGLRKDEEYKIQKSSAEGRPDATVFLPEGRCVFIDAKTSLSSWEGFVNADTEEEKAICLKNFMDSTKSHISNLAKKDYSSENSSPDYVLMFIPIESCYSLLFCENCVLWDFAWKNRIMPVSPSTLLAALKIINVFYVVDRQNKNAIEISRLCSNMLDKFSSLLSELLKIRENLNSSLKKLDGKDSILSQIRRIENLGVSGKKSVPEIPEDFEN